MNPTGGEEILAKIQEFLTGTREAQVPDRILATVLFGDLVPPPPSQRIGDARYRQLVELFLDAVRTELHRYRGREVDTAGDGFFASFDGPARASGARRLWPRPPDASGWRSVSVFTPERSKSWATSSPASRSTSVPGSGRWRRATRSSCPARSATSWPAPGSGSRTVGPLAQGSRRRLAPVCRRRTVVSGQRRDIQRQQVAHAPTRGGVPPPC